MNLENKFLRNEIYEGRIDIAIFVSDSKYYFVFDDKENFTIDIKPFYDRYLSKKIITDEQYQYAIKNYRGGASKLSKETLGTYFSSLDAPPRDYLWMKYFFTDGYSNESLKKIYLNNKSDDIRLLIERLPRFYINLDKKIFIHNYRERFFEEDLPKSWKGEMLDNFFHLIPNDYSYWIVDGLNFGKFL